MKVLRLLFYYLKQYNALRIRVKLERSRVVATSMIVFMKGFRKMDLLCLFKRILNLIGYYHKLWTPLKIFGRFKDYFSDCVHCTKNVIFLYIAF